MKLLKTNKNALHANCRNKSSKQKSEEEKPPTTIRVGRYVTRQRLKEQQYEPIADAKDTSHQYGRIERKGIKGSNTYNRLQEQPKGSGCNNLKTQKQSHLSRFAQFCSKRSSKQNNKNPKAKKEKEEIRQHKKVQVQSLVQQEMPRKEQSCKEGNQQEQKKRLYYAPSSNNDVGSNGVYSTSSSFEALWLSSHGSSEKTRGTHTSAKPPVRDRLPMEKIDIVNEKNPSKPNRKELSMEKTSTKLLGQDDNDSPIDHLFNHLEKKHGTKLVNRAKFIGSETEPNHEKKSILPPKRDASDTHPERSSETPKKKDIKRSRRGRSVTRTQSSPGSLRNKRNPTSPRPRVLTTQSPIKPKTSVKKKRGHKKKSTTNSGSMTKDASLEESSETSRTDSSISSRARSRSVSRRSSSRRSSSQKPRPSSRAKSKSRARSSSRKRRPSGRKMQVEDARKLLNPTDHPTYLIRPVYSSSEDEDEDDKEPKSPKSRKSPKRRAKRNSSKDRGFCGLPSQGQQVQPRKGKRPNRQCQEINTKEESPTETAKQMLTPGGMAQYPNPFVKPIYAKE